LTISAFQLVPEASDVGGEDQRAFGAEFLDERFVDCPENVGIGRGVFLAF